MAKKTFDTRARAFDVYCKNEDCMDRIMGPQKSGLYKHIFDSYQNQRFAKRPAGVCAKCGQEYDLTNESTFLRETPETALAKKAETAGNLASQKVLDDAETESNTAVNKKKQALVEKSKSAGQAASDKVKKTGVQKPKKAASNKNDGEGVNFSPNSNPGDNIDSIPGL